MHAVVAMVKVEQPEEARAALSTDRVPLVRRAPGLAAGYWLEPVDGVGLSVLIFESKEHAEAAASYPMPPLPGTSVLRVDVREVYAHVAP